MEKSLKVGDNAVIQDMPEFNEHYVVLSDNNSFKLEKDVMQYMLDFKKKYDINVEIVIKDGRTYVKVFTGDIFEPRIYRYTENKERLWAFFKVIKC